MKGLSTLLAIMMIAVLAVFAITPLEAQNDIQKQDTAVMSAGIQSEVAQEAVPIVDDVPIVDSDELALWYPGKLLRQRLRANGFRLGSRLRC